MSDGPVDLLDRLRELPMASPDISRGDRLRTRCHKTLARRRRISLIWHHASKISESLIRGQASKISESLTWGQASQISGGQGTAVPLTNGEART